MGEVLIDDDWIAIRSPSVTSNLTKNQGFDCDINVTWNCDSHLIEISCIYIDKDGKKVNHSSCYSVDGFSSNHLQLKGLFPELEIELPAMPNEPRGRVNVFSFLK